jgi:phosphate-selective porin
MNNPLNFWPIKLYRDAHIYTLNRFLKRPSIYAALAVLYCAPGLAVTPPQLSAVIMYDRNNYQGDLFDKVYSPETKISFLRRVKLSAEMDVSEKLGATFSVDLDTDDDKFKVDDAFLSYQFTKALDLYAGRFKEPFGLENQQSLKTQYLMERSAPTNLMTYGRHTGISLRYENDWWTAQSAMMNIPSEDDDFDDAYAYVGRATFAPIHRKKQFIHIGAGYSQRDATDGKYQLESEFIARGVGDLLKSAKYDAENIKAANGEFAAQYAKVLLQGEYLAQEVATKNEGDILLDGGYVTVMWTALGKAREYDHGAIKFNPSAHTVEIAYRYSEMNLTGGIKADEARAHELAVNYYLNNSIKCTVQYGRAKHKDWDDDGEVDSTSGDTLNFRIQFLWE